MNVKVSFAAESMTFRTDRPREMAGWMRNNSAPNKGNWRIILSETQLGDLTGKGAEILAGGKRPKSKMQLEEVPASIPSSPTSDAATESTAEAAETLSAEIENFLDDLYEEATAVAKGGRRRPISSQLPERNLVSEEQSQDSSAPTQLIPETWPRPVAKPEVETHPPRQRDPPIAEARGAEPAAPPALSAISTQPLDNREAIARTRVLDDLEQRLRFDDHGDADVLGKLALLNHRQGRHANAEALYLRSLQIREESLGPSHPAVATSLNNLAQLYRGQGRALEAQQLLERSLQIVENNFGPNHPKTALRVGNLADLHGAQLDYARAETYYRRLLEIMERMSEPAPKPAVLMQSLENYVEMLRATQRHKEAHDLRIRIKSLPL